MEAIFLTISSDSTDLMLVYGKQPTHVTQDTKKSKCHPIRVKHVPPISIQFYSVFTRQVLAIAVPVSSILLTVHTHAGHGPLTDTFQWVSLVEKHTVPSHLGVRDNTNCKRSWFKSKMQKRLSRG